MIFFTSDLHLGHENCIRLCNRPFSSIEEMDETLIENWNHKVTGKDTVYILGDLIYRSQKPPEEYLRRLRGKKHLILGNHDRGWIRSCQTEQFFESVNNLLYVADGKRQYTLCHYPMMVRDGDGLQRDRRWGDAHPPVPLSHAVPQAGLHDPRTPPPRAGPGL